MQKTKTGAMHLSACRSERDALIVSKLHLVDNMLHHYAFLKMRGIEPEDLFGAGCIGLIMGIDNLHERTDVDVDDFLISSIKTFMQEDISLLTNQLSVSTYISRLQRKYFRFCKQRGYVTTSDEAIAAFAKTYNKPYNLVFVIVNSLRDALEIETPLCYDKDEDDEEDTTNDIKSYTSGFVVDENVEEDIIRRERREELHTILKQILTDSEYQIMVVSLKTGLHGRKLAVHLEQNENTIYAFQRRAYAKIRSSPFSERIHKLLKLLA